MDFQLFLFLLLMSFVSFAIGVLTWIAVVRIFGRGNTTSKIMQFIFIPLMVLGYNFLVIISGEYRFAVGAIPLLLIAGIALYYRFAKGGAYYDAPAPSELKKDETFQRKESNKSRRIREKREKKRKRRNKK